MIKTKQELRRLDIKPIKHRGQNFLVSPEITKKIIASARIKSGETILEVGPGTGNLTRALLESGANVAAIEKDSKLVQLLISNFQFLISKQKLKTIEGDILKFDETTLKPPYRIIANIPYYLTGALIQKFLLSPNKPSEMILMVQKEVGERITARPPKANYLSSLIQFLAEAKVLFSVKKENFWPQPKVDSAVIRITPKRHATRDKRQVDEYISFLKVTFKQPRQTLFNNLRKSETIPSDKLKSIFSELGLNKKTRPQNLNQQQLIQLFNLLAF